MVCICGLSSRFFFVASIVPVGKEKMKIKKTIKTIHGKKETTTKSTFSFSSNDLSSNAQYASAVNFLVVVIAPRVFISKMYTKNRIKLLDPLS